MHTGHLLTINCISPISLFSLKYVRACDLQLIQILPDICSYLHQDFTEQIFASPFFNVESGFIFHGKTNPPDPILHGTFRYDFFSQHTKWQKTCFVQHNLYHGFIIGSRPHAKLVSFAREMFLEYWQTHDTLVDYLMIDYILMIAYQEFPDIKAEIDSLPWSSERLYDLVHMLDTPYDEEEWNKLSEECIFSKLDWHRKYKSEINGKDTYYSHMLTLTEE